MKLKIFIKKLKKIEKNEGGNIKVFMADNIPVVEPVFLKTHFDKKIVVITDIK